MNKPPEYLQHVGDMDLQNLINHQQHIVDMCIELAQIKAADQEDPVPHSCEGLYFAQLRYSELIAELKRRYNQ